jgi:membrane protein DedA with SNARE-associated domain
VLWTSLYLGLGFVIGSNIEAANQFLGNLTGLLAALAVLIISTAYRRNHAARSGRTG